MSVNQRASVTLINSLSDPSLGTRIANFIWVLWVSPERFVFFVKALMETKLPIMAIKGGHVNPAKLQSNLVLRRFVLNLTRACLCGRCSWFRHEAGLRLGEVHERLGLEAAGWLA